MHVHNQLATYRDASRGNELDVGKYSLALHTVKPKLVLSDLLMLSSTAYAVTPQRVYRALQHQPPLTRVPSGVAVGISKDDWPRLSRLQLQHKFIPAGATAYPFPW